MFSLVVDVVAIISSCYCTVLYGLATNLGFKLCVNSCRIYSIKAYIEFLRSKL